MVTNIVIGVLILISLLGVLVLVYRFRLKKAQKRVAYLELGISRAKKDLRKSIRPLAVIEEAATGAWPITEPRPSTFLTRAEETLARALEGQMNGAGYYED